MTRGFGASGGGFIGSESRVVLEVEHSSFGGRCVCEESDATREMSRLKFGWRREGF